MPALTQAKIGWIAPCFVVNNVAETIAFYRDKLGFEVYFEDPVGDPFFAIVQRDSVMVFLKHGDAQPTPNMAQNGVMKWDAYVGVPDPDALATEFAANRAEFQTPLGITSENLRGFDVRDPNGYVLFFGRPNEQGLGTGD